MKLIRTHEITPYNLPKSETERLWIYNGLDCCVTAEILDVLLPQLDNVTRNTYEFSKSLQGPVLEMRCRGVRIDRERRNAVVAELLEKREQLETQLETIAAEGLGMFGFNYRSNPQIQELFYGKLRIPPIKRRGRVTVDREALEKMEAYPIARPILNHLIALRDIDKKVGVLRTEIDPDGRMRTSYNIAGTTTGRLSSSFSDFGTGTNLQNIEESIRSIFVSDDGMKMAYIDKQQGESYCVGAIEWNLFGDGRYLDACESRDLHTYVSRLAWPGLPWTGDLATDREIAERPFYRHYSHRHMAKVLGHGTNYLGQPWTMATHTKIPEFAISEFQPVYFRAFPSHCLWHDWVRRELLEQGYLVSLTGRRRWFMGRRNEEETVRAAVAFNPQGSLADILNADMLRVWQADLGQLLMQIHDAFIIQYPEDQEDEVIPKVLDCLNNPLELRGGRNLLIPSDVAVGWNWGKATEGNPGGLKKYQPKDSRRRPEKLHILDRVRNAHPRKT